MRRLGLAILALLPACSSFPAQPGCNGPSPMPRFARVGCKMLPVPHQYYLPRYGVYWASLRGES